jgi:hypothetical protein
MRDCYGTTVLVSIGKGHDVPVIIVSGIGLSGAWMPPLTVISFSFFSTAATIFFQLLAWRGAVALF